MQTNSSSQAEVQPRRRYFGKRELKLRQRDHFRQTMKVYRELRSVLGSAIPIADASRNTGAQGAQYGDNKGLPYVDFVIDVDRTIEKELEPAQRVLLQEVLDHEDLLPVKQSKELIEIQALLGRRFKSLKLYPAKEYFINIKEKRNVG